MVHVITGPIGHLSDFLELLPLDLGGPEQDCFKIGGKMKCSVLWKFNKASPIIYMAFESEIVDIL